MFDVSTQWSAAWEKTELPNSVLVFTRQLPWACSKNGRAGWAKVRIEADTVLLESDHLRSFAIFWKIDLDNQLIRVADQGEFLALPPSSANAPSLENLKKNFPTSHIPTFLDSDESKEELLHLGFLLDDHTFYSSVQAIGQGERVRISRVDGSVQRENYQPFNYTPTALYRRPEIFTNAFAKAFNNGIDTFLTSFDTYRAAQQKAFPTRRPPRLVMPLSGGWDSRLLAASLALRGRSSEVLCFSYGKANSTEWKVAKQVADSLGLSFTAVTLDPAILSSDWQTPQAANFCRYTANSTSLPHIQDWYAVKTLRANGKIQAGDVILPGHTIVGNLQNEADYRQLTKIAGKELANLPKSSVSPNSSQTADSNNVAHKALIANWLNKLNPYLTATLTKDHAYLQGVKPAQLPKIQARISKLVERYWPQWLVDPVTGDVLNPANLNLQIAGRCVSTCLENFNVRERQTKYINNSVRAYEYFDCLWALPMLDLDLWNVYGGADMQITANRNWYAQWITKLYAQAVGTLHPERGATNAVVASESGGSRTLKAFLHQAAIKLARLTKLNHAASRLLLVKSSSDHPLAFEALANYYSVRKRRRLHLRGVTLLGVFSQLFADGTWNSASASNSQPPK